ncbi:MAG: hypothetical protein J6C27_01900 [Clostridia bacterium]|nr:hypothetical protein [Clostridia bacterium]
MKKILCIISLVLLVGCNAESNIKPVTRNISFTAEMTYYNEYYEMAAEIYNNGDAKISLTHPEELSGLTFNIKNNDVIAEFNGIKIETDDSYKTAAVNFLYSAFKAENQKVNENNDRFFTKGKCDGGEYTMYISGTGLPLKICDSADRFEIIIKNLTIQKEKQP